MEALHKEGEDGASQDRRHVGGVHGGAMVMETTMIPKVILFTI
jgi:hypothetical protein